MKKKDFDPNGIGLNNGHFMGLPFTREDARIIVLSAPWDVTTSYSEGTALAPDRIMKASTQLDLFDPEIPEAWKSGIFLRPSDRKWIDLNNQYRQKAKKHIEFLESGGSIDNSNEMKENLLEINTCCENLHDWLYLECIAIIEKNKLPAVLGGEHSTALGILKALSEKHGPLGVLQIDAHMDLRKSYEGFTYSHASVFNNAIDKGYVSKLVQVGIRDNCEEETRFAEINGIDVYYDDELKKNSFNGLSWHKQCQKIISSLPEEVYLSFDIDGLNPHLCPHTGTPVPGGLEFSESIYLIRELVKSGRKIIGFDLCEVGNQEWDANVGARLLYKISCWAARSQEWI